MFLDDPIGKKKIEETGDGPSLQSVMIEDQISTGTITAFNAINMTIEETSIIDEVTIGTSTIEIKEISMIEIDLTIAEEDLLEGKI